MLKIIEKPWGKEEIYLSSRSLPKKSSGTLASKNGAFQVSKKVFLLCSFKEERSVFVGFHWSDRDVLELLGVPLFFGPLALYDLPNQVGHAYSHADGGAREQNAL